MGDGQNGRGRAPRCGDLLMSDSLDPTPEEVSVAVAVFTFVVTAITVLVRRESRTSSRLSVLESNKRLPLFVLPQKRAVKNERQSVRFVLRLNSEEGKNNVFNMN